MSLQDKISEGCIGKSDYNEFVSSYLDAIEHPEKYPELIEAFRTSLLISYKFDKEDIDNWRNSGEWRDFCFKHFIGGRER